MHHPEKDLKDLRNFLANQNEAVFPSLKSFALSSTTDVPADVLQLLLRIRKTTNLASQAQAVGFPPETSHLSNALRIAHQVRDTLASKVKATPEVSNMTEEAWSATHAEQTEAWAKDALCRARDAFQRMNTLNDQCAKGTKPAFNHEYTPFLEEYFEHNAYPTAPDRARLAKKCMMTPRQIEVWFQNHRNRARKDGKTLCRYQGEPLELESSFTSLERKMPLFTIPPQERSSANSVTLDRDYSEEVKIASPLPLPAQRLVTDSFKLYRPPYAFPTTYSPRPDGDSFQATNHKFPPPTWPRTPATPHRTRNVPIDMEDLCRDFAQKLRFPVKNQRSGATQSWCATRTVVPSTAPHPALIRPHVHVISNHSSPIWAPRSPVPRLHSPEPPQPTDDTTPARRKVARLPRRIPKNPSITPHHDSEISPVLLRFSSPTSRSSSSGSESLSRRSSFSSSGSSSSPSGPTTPLQPGLALLDDDIHLITISSSESHNEVVRAESASSEPFKSFRAFSHFNTHMLPRMSFSDSLLLPS